MCVVYFTIDDILDAKYLKLSDYLRYISFSGEKYEAPGKGAAEVKRIVLKNQNTQKRLARDHFKKSGKIEVWVSACLLLLYFLPVQGL